MMVIALVISLAITMATPASAVLAGKRICVDPGHGGSDPGAVYGRTEADLNWDMAKRLEHQLIGKGASVKLTRGQTDGPDSRVRAQVCNDFKADVVLSIHLNASTAQTTDYTQVFYGKSVKDLSFARAMDASFSVRVVTLDGVAIEGTRLEHKAPTVLANSLLLNTKMPAVLVESVFLSHPGEQLALSANQPAAGYDFPAGQWRRDEIVAELLKGLDAFLK